MEERNSKVIAIVALCVGVVGLSLGFAAFSSRLTVSSGATVTVNQETQFTNKFGFVSGTPAKKAEGSTVTGEVEVGEIVIAGDETYGKVWQNISADFKGTNEVAIFTATVKNDSAFVAKLEEQPAAVVANCTSADSENPATEPYLTNACNTINVAVNAPETIAANGEGTVTVTITGPTTEVDGSLNVDFTSIYLDYTTAQ